MPKAAPQGKNETMPSPSPRIWEVFFLLATGVALFLTFALLTYHRADPGWSTIKHSTHILNLEGHAGAWISDFLLYMFGYSAYLIPAMLLYGVLMLCMEWRHKGRRLESTTLILRSIGFLSILLTSCGLASLHIPNIQELPASAGGALGEMISWSMTSGLNVFGATFILILLLLCGVTLFTRLSWLQLIDKLGQQAITAFHFFTAMAITGLKKIKRPSKTPKIKKQKSTPTRKEKPKKTAVFADVAPLPDDTTHTLIKRPTQHKKTGSLALLDKKSYPLSLNLLDLPQAQPETSYTNQQLEELSRNVETKLADFNIEAKVVAVHPGPVVTRFELELAAGTKVSKVSALDKDLARSLSVVSVRVVEVIPGKAVIALELPNIDRQIVRLREVISSMQYVTARSPLTLALGKDISGHPVVVDLGKMPHLLVAGTTGSGKSVGVNAMLLSLLYKSTPKEVRLILIDPKMLELSIYDGIPHLLTPVITDMKDAAGALRWCVAEMERRYRLMASLGVRNIAGYNKKVKEANAKGAPLLDPLWQTDDGEEPEHLIELPNIVVFADEFADMMMVVGKKIEELIARIAQKARAAGIHLLLATQRPSVDVITGLIKANIPTRIAFQVSSKIDSRTILDQQGAQQLLGNGDMLYLPPGTGLPVRVHGAFVSDDEVHRVVAELKKNGEPDYLDIFDADDSALSLLPGEEAAGDESDPLYDQAIDIVTQTRRASISSLQRRLKIGFNRAARIIESMEAAGVVGPMEGGSRDVLAPEPME